jgi:hypothetical protein
MTQRSIVSRTALAAALLTGGATVVLAGIVFETQQNLLELRIEEGIASEVTRIAEPAKGLPMDPTHSGLERWTTLLNDLSAVPNVIATHFYIAQSGSVLTADGELTPLATAE